MGHFKWPSGPSEATAVPGNGIVGVGDLLCPSGLLPYLHVEVNNFMVESLEGSRFSNLDQILTPTANSLSVTIPKPEKGFLPRDDRKALRQEPMQTSLSSAIMARDDQSSRRMIAYFA